MEEEKKPKRQMNEIQLERFCVLCAFFAHLAVKRNTVGEVISKLTQKKTAAHAT